MMTKTRNYPMFFLFLFLLSNSAFSANESSGLVSYWNFDEGFGKTVKDISGNGNDGEIYGAKWIKVGKGYGLEFDGNDYINFGNKPEFSFDKGVFSIELCIKPKCLKKPAYVLTKGGVSEFAIGIGGGYLDRVIMFIGSWDNYRYSVKGALRKNCWTHIVFVKDGTNLNCYIDGELSNGDVTVIPSSVKGSSNLVIGGVGYGNFIGVIDEVKIYNRALSSEEVKTRYKQIPLPFQKKYLIKTVLRILKYGLIVAIAIVTVLIRKYWIRYS